MNVPDLAYSTITVLVSSPALQLPGLGHFQAGRVGDDVDAEQERLPPSSFGILVRLPEAGQRLRTVDHNRPAAQLDPVQLEFTRIDAGRMRAPNGMLAL